MMWLGPFKNASVCLFFFGIKKSFICLSIWDNCISDKQPLQIGFSRPERRRHFFYDQAADHKGHHLARKTQLLVRWCKTANSLSLSLIRKDVIFFPSVLYSMFFCVLLGNFSKIKIKKGVWKNRSAFDTNWLNYKQKLPLLHSGSRNQTLSCPNIPSFPNSLKSLSTTFCWLLHTPCCHNYFLFISWWKQN